MNSRTRKAVAGLGGPLLGAALLGTPSADAATMWTKGFRPTAQVEPGGGQLTQELIVGCTDRTLEVRMTASQADAYGFGTATTPCTGGEEIVPVTVTAAENTFEPGAATVCALVISRNPAGHAKDTEQRCRSVELVNG